MAIDFSKVTAVKIPEGNVTEIKDTNNSRTIWSNAYTLDLTHFVYAKTETSKIWFVNKNAEDMAFLQKALKDTTTTGINYKGTVGVKLFFKDPTAGTYNFFIYLVYGTASGPYEDVYSYSIKSGDFTLTSSAYKSFTGYTAATHNTRDEWRSLTTFWIGITFDKAVINWIKTSDYTMLGKYKVRYVKS